MAAPQRNCGHCENPLPSSADVRRRYCNSTCRAAKCTASARVDGRFDRWRLATLERQRKPISAVACIVCGVVVTTKYSGRKYCSNRCSAKASYEARKHTTEWRAAHRDACKRRRARKRAVEIEKFTSAEIFDRDRYRCHICRQKCNPAAAVPDPLAPTVDHLIPLAHGGGHTRANVSTACFLCNSVKGDRGGAEQLALI